MRAVVVDSVGGPEVVEVVETGVPEPGERQIRIKVAVAALNPVDAGVRAGVFGALQGRTGLGWDVAGTVDAVGGAGPWSVGDAVVALHYGMVKPSAPTPSTSWWTRTPWPRRRRPRTRCTRLRCR